MHHAFDRRDFLKTLGTLAGAAAAGSPLMAQGQPRFRISLAQWSFHKALRAKQMDNLDFAVRARKEFDIEAVEYVNQFFQDKAKDTKYLGQMKERADDHAVKSLLIMCDGEGHLGDPDTAGRAKAVENHYRWVEAATFLGCHSIRVNAQSKGSWDEQRTLAADGLRRLSEFGAKHDIDVIVENHGGLSSNGQWLSQVMKAVDHPRCGTLPDFGNFRIGPGEEYDRYKGVAELMPWAKGVSAKSNDFDAQGNEVAIDYGRMIEIVLGHGYKGYIGIEYEGERLSEAEGVAATKKLLQRYQHVAFSEPTPLGFSRA
jgi:L-ribulose-5-phosphate 3-epimerase